MHHVLSRFPPREFLRVAHRLGGGGDTPPGLAPALLQLPHRFVEAQVVFNVAALPAEALTGENLPEHRQPH